MLAAVVMSAFAARLVQLQAIDADEYANAAAEMRTQTTVLPAVRGEIVDRNGAPLATTLDTVRVIADPETVIDPAGTAELLAPLLDRDPAELAARLAQSPRRWVPLADHVSRETWRAIEALDLDGLYVEPQPRRHYPTGPAAATLIGFVGQDGHGLGGLERGLEETLAGADGSRTYEKSGNREIATAGYREEAPEPGQGVQLTIDRDVQWKAQEAIAAQVEESGAESGTVVVLVPSTGEILALAEAPSFDPSNVGDADPDDLGNRAVGEVFEPGSTAKVMALAAAFEEGVVERGERLEVPGAIQRAGETFNDYVAHGTWQLTPAGVLAKSSNIGTIMIAERIEPETLHSYYWKFGLGQPTGLGIPGESAGTLADPGDWWGSQRYTIPFGQGLAVNAVQMASVYATIANGGVRVEPTLVKGYLNDDREVDAAPTTSATRVVSQATAQEISMMLEGVVSDGGTAPDAGVPGYRTAGKTGTAYRYDTRCRSYCGYTVSFIGYAPADEPAVVVACTLQNPVNGPIGGGSLCGPVFTEVMTFALQSLKIPPTGSGPPALPITW